jgi:class 3 adenylate cyclase/tetratricopeptide (TPR) repeat protein
MEKAAGAGEIVVSSATAQRLPPDATTATRGPGLLLRWRSARGRNDVVVPRREVDAEVVAEHVPVGLRSHLAAVAPEPEHRLATVGFVKFSGVDQLLSARPADDVAHALDELVTGAQEALEAEGVTFLASDIDANGGKLVVAAGVPTSVEDDAGRVIRALRRIVDLRSPFELHAGVHRGHVFVGEVGTRFRSTYTVMGDTVNLAARLMAAAPTGAVYVTGETIDEARSLFALTPLPPLSLKGKTKPLPSFSVAEELGPRARDVALELPHVGRDREVQRVVDALRDARAGTGSSLDIVGATGVGKSRLLVEARRHEPDISELVLQGEAYAASTPYGLLRSPIRQLLGIDDTTPAARAERLERSVAALDRDLLGALPLLGDVVDVAVPPTPETQAIVAEFRPERVADAVVRLLCAAFPGPLLIAVEDAHWADDLSAHVLLRVEAAVTSDRPWALVVTRRAEPEAFVPALADRLQLEPLQGPDARSLVLVASDARPLLPHEVDGIVHRGGGNPLYLSEIVRLLLAGAEIDALPTSLDAVVNAQIDALHPVSRRVLRYAAVLGRTFRRPLLVELLRGAGTPFPEDPALGPLLDVGRDEVSFRHAVVRDAAYQGLSYRRRRELHHLAAEAIERIADGETEEHAADLALHYALAGDAARAWEHGKLAGSRARAAYANVEAAAHFERAVAAVRGLPDVPDTERAEVYSALGDVREQAGMFERARLAYQSAIRLVRDDPIAHAELLLRRARAHERAGDYRRALRDTNAGHKLVSTLTSPPALSARARLLSFAAVVRQAQERPNEASTMAERAVTEARFADDRSALARAFVVLDWATRLLGERDDAAFGERALALYEELEDLEGQALVTANLGVEAYFEGRWSAAIELYRRASDAYLQLGNTVQSALSGGNVGELLINQGRIEEAEPILRDAARTMRAARYDDGATFAEIQLARVAIARGDISSATEQLTALHDELIAAGEFLSALDAAIHLASCRSRLGDPAGALDLIDKAAAACGDEAALWGPALARARAEALMVSGSFDEADAEAVDGIADARKQNLPFDLAMLLQLRGEVARRAGRRPYPAEMAEAETLAAAVGFRLADLASLNVSTSDRQSRRSPR